MKKLKHIEIVVTNTVDLDLMSNATVKKIKDSLDQKYQKVSITMIDDENDLKKLIERRPDLVFSGVKYLGFDDKSKKRSSKNKIWLSSILQQNGINHTGSETAALKLEINKIKAKRALLEEEIRTARFFTAVPGEFKVNSIMPIEFPLFIKPIYEGGGKGINEGSVVRNFKEFEDKILDLHNEGNKEILVERYLSGREFTIGVIRNLTTKKLDAFPVELIPQKNSRGDRILGEKDKQEDLELVVSIKEKKIFDSVARFAKKAFKALGARDYGRIDLRMDCNNQLYFLEANLIPGLGGGYFSRALSIVGEISYSKMIKTLAALAIKRSC